jgi:hypothetical protein
MPRAGAALGPKPDRNMSHVGAAESTKPIAEDQDARGHRQGEAVQLRHTLIARHQFRESSCFEICSYAGEGAGPFPIKDLVNGPFRNWGLVPFGIDVDQSPWGTKNAQ